MNRREAKWRALGIGAGVIRAAVSEGEFASYADVETEEDEGRLEYALLEVADELDRRAASYGRHDP